MHFNSTKSVKMHSGQAKYCMHIYTPPPPPPYQTLQSTLHITYINGFSINVFVKNEKLCFTASYNTKTT